MRVIRLATPQLIVKDHTPSRASDSFQRFEIVMRHPGSAVQTEQGKLPIVFALADDAIPCSKAAKRDETFLDGKTHVPSLQDR